jgi:8-oxo-dGTP diphosphatase
MTTQGSSDAHGSQSRSTADSHDRPLVTVDVVLFAVRNDDPDVLLVRRKFPPFADHWAIPGGFVHKGESLEEAACRELQEDRGSTNVAFEQLHAFGDPGRDPRGWVITIAYLALVGRDHMPLPRGGDDAAEARWWSMANLPPLAFDHDRILRHAEQQLRWRLAQTD